MSGPKKKTPMKHTKIIGAWLEVSKEITRIERQTYSLLEWIGDVGGLIDGLSILARIFIAPISAYSLKATMKTLMPDRP